MPDQHDDFVRLIDRVSELVDQIKTMVLNLSVASAKLQVDDPAIRTAGGSFRELLDRAHDSFSEAEVAIKRAKGMPVTEVERTVTLTELDDNLARIQRAAEQLLHAIAAVRGRRRVDREYYE